MNCEEARLAMLEGSGAAAVKAHLAKCPACAGIARQWLALKTALPSRMPAPPLEIDVRIRAAARERVRNVKGRRLFFKIAASFAAAAAIAVVSVTVALNMLPGSAPAPSGIEWESVAMNGELLKLSADIDSATRLLSAPRRDFAPQQDIDNSLQALSVEVPDLLT